MRLLLLCRRQCCQRFRVRRHQLNVLLRFLPGLQRLCLPLRHQQPFLQLKCQQRNNRLRLQPHFLPQLKSQQLNLQLQSRRQLFLLQLFLLRLNPQPLFLPLRFPQLFSQPLNHRLRPRQIFHQQLNLLPPSLLRLSLPLLNRLRLNLQQLSLPLPFHLLKPLPLFPRPLPTVSVGAHDPCPTTERVSSLTATSAMRRV